MTAKETEALRKLETAINEMSINLFGNGTRKGCIDERLEHVEADMESIKEIMPKMVTREHCSKRHETKWSHAILILGVIATWTGLFLFAVDVL